MNTSVHNINTSVFKNDLHNHWVFKKFFQPFKSFEKSMGFQHIKARDILTLQFDLKFSVDYRLVILVRKE